MRNVPGQCRCGQNPWLPSEWFIEPRWGLARVSPWHCVVTVCPLLPLSEGEKDFPSRRCVCSVHVGSSFPLGEPSAVHRVTCRALGDLAVLSYKAA